MKGERKEERKSLKNGRKETKETTEKEKEEKKKDPIILNKKIEGREKEGKESFFYSFSFLSPLKNERKMEKEREENTYSQGHGKEKDLVYQNGKQGLKLCNFI